MIPNLLPHPRHAEAVRFMHEIERENVKRIPGQSLAARGHWKHSPEDMTRYLLILCNRTSSLSDRDFKSRVLEWLVGVSEFPPKVVEPPEMSATFDPRRAGSLDHPWQGISADGDI